MRAAYEWPDTIEDWDDIVDGKKWIASDLSSYEFYLQVYLPSRTKLGRYLEGQDDE